LREKILSGVGKNATTDLPGGRGHGHLTEMWPYKKFGSREKCAAVKVAVKNFVCRDTNLAKFSAFVKLFIIKWKTKLKKSQNFSVGSFMVFRILGS